MRRSVATLTVGASRTRAGTSAQSREPVSPLRRAGAAAEREVRRVHRLVAHDSVRAAGLLHGLRARQPARPRADGDVAPGAEYDALLARLEEDFHALRDAETGEPVDCAHGPDARGVRGRGASRTSRSRRLLARARSPAASRDASARRADAVAASPSIAAAITPLRDCWSPLVARCDRPVARAT